MITVTLGTNPFPFSRAIAWLQELLEKGVIIESVFIQHGTSDVSTLISHPLVSAAPFVKVDHLMNMIDQSTLVISHAGQGTTRSLMERQSPFVLLPRLARYGEHVDNHQLRFAQALAPKGIVHCLSVVQLEAVILDPPLHEQQPLFDGPRLADHLLSRYPSKHSESVQSVYEQPRS
ncbi:MAG: hypothetical protein KTR27_05290 [Leptolyngbyaceae cyanobacterium MAG.088]|nr:hypothetical protein [Leptolyngbyaceae cyanobacterium MAG.088]